MIFHQVAKGERLSLFPRLALRERRSLKLMTLGSHRAFTSLLRLTRSCKRGLPALR
jgi:hypothetical protein